MALLRYLLGYCQVPFFIFYCIPTDTVNGPSCLRPRGPGAINPPSESNRATLEAFNFVLEVLYL